MLLSCADSKSQKKSLLIPYTDGPLTATGALVYDVGTSSIAPSLPVSGDIDAVKNTTMGLRYQRAHSHRSDSTSGSAPSYTSDQSHSTAPLERSVRPVLTHYATGPAKIGKYLQEAVTYSAGDPRASMGTFASTVPSLEDLHDQPEHEVPAGDYEVFPTDAVPSTAPEFSDLFPTCRRFSIQHNDSASDGNMNLRVDVDVVRTSGRKQKMTLFHLRMKDLKDRQFSLRRYCRESGREVCHSSRKHVQNPASKPKRPALQRSLSSALQTLGLKLEQPATFQHHELGYESDGEEYDAHVLPNHSNERVAQAQPSMPTNTIRLEFSNYAQVEVHRRKVKNVKRYDFEYWGASYRWQREVCFVSDFKEISYSLVHHDRPSKSIAHITPQPLSHRELINEEHQGGWIPPSSLVITDKGVIHGSTDIAEYVHL